MLPNYGVFDNLTFSVDEQTREVTLAGQVRQPQLKNRAEQAVRGIEGVETVKNEIEVLPNSPNDDRIRLAVYRAIYGQPALQRYQIMAVPPVHILVKNGQVTLEGWLNSNVERTAAEAAARSTSGVLGVTNNIRIESEQSQE